MIFQFPVQLVYLLDAIADTAEGFLELFSLEVQENLQGKIQKLFSLGLFVRQ